MKFTIAIILTFAASAFAQEHLAEGLKNGILEEDSKQNPAAAIQQYQAVLNQFADARQTAAMALFRMAECYRKEGKRGPAVAAYQRVLRDFSDQYKVAGQSRNILATTYKEVAGAVPTPAPRPNDRAQFDKLMESVNQQQAGVTAARARYRETIKGEIEVVKQQLALAESRYKGGVDPIDVQTNLKVRLLQLDRDLAAFDAGMAPSNSR